MATLPAHEQSKVCPGTYLPEATATDAITRGYRLVMSIAREASDSRRSMRLTVSSAGRRSPPTHGGEYSNPQTNDMSLETSDPKHVLPSTDFSSRSDHPACGDVHIRQFVPRPLCSRMEYASIYTRSSSGLQERRMSTAGCIRREYCPRERQHLASPIFPCRPRQPQMLLWTDASSLSANRGPATWHAVVQRCSTAPILHRSRSPPHADDHR